MIKKYVAPDGAAIIGTLESIPAVALIEGIDTSTGDVIYTGDTQTKPDDMVTVMKGRRPMFVDIHGRHWTMGQISPEDGLQGFFGRRSGRSASSMVSSDHADADRSHTGVSVEVV